MLLESKTEKKKEQGIESWEKLLLHFLMEDITG